MSNKPSHTSAQVQLPSLTRVIETVVANYPYTSDRSASLSFDKGDIIYVTTKLGSGWWEGATASGSRGWFPSNYIQPIAASSLASLTRADSLDSSELSQTSQVSSNQTTVATSPSTMASSSQTATPDDVDHWGLASSIHSLREGSTSRKGSIASYESSATGDESIHSVAPGHSALTTTGPAETYAPVDTTDPDYKFPASYWLPQINSAGKLVYINADRKHVSMDIPWERVDVGPGEIDDIPLAVAVPPDFVENRRMPTSFSSEDHRLYERFTDPYSSLSRKSRASSSASIDYTSSSLETSLMSVKEFTEDEFEKTWTDVITKLKLLTDKVDKDIVAEDDTAFLMDFNDLTIAIHKISLYMGVPPGAFPSSYEFGELPLTFRRLMNTLNRMSVFHSIETMKRYQGRPAARFNPDNASLRKMLSQLHNYAVALIHVYRLGVQKEQSLQQGQEVPFDDNIRVPPEQFPIKYFVDGTWSNIVVTRAGQLVPQTATPVPGAQALLNKRFGDDDKEPEPSQIALESYNTSLTLDSEVIAALAFQLKTVKNILAQFVKLSGTSPAAKSIDVTQDRRKVLSSSLHSLIKVSQAIVSVLESIDLTVFYACRPSSASDPHSTMQHLYSFLEAKQSIYDSMADLVVVLKQNDAANSDFIAALTEKFQKTNIEEVYFSYEHTNEQLVRDKVFKLDAVLEDTVGKARNLAAELQTIVSIDTRLLGVPRERQSSIVIGDTRTRNMSTVSSLRSSFSSRRKESAAETASIGSTTRDTGPWYLQLEHGDEIVYDKKGSIRGGSVRALVEQLTLHSRLNSEFNVAMLYTFRSFMDPQTLFQLLVERFLIQPPVGLTSDEFQIWTEKKQKPTRLRVVNILKTWLESYWFEDDNEEEISSEARKALFDGMVKFANQLKTQKFPGAVSLSNIVEKRRAEQLEPSWKRMIATNNSPKPSPILPKSLKKFKLSDIDPVEMARQLCVREYKLLSLITAHECLMRGCGGGKTGGRNIGDFIRNSNSLTNWVAYAILRHAEAKRRASCIRYFINVADECRRLQNYSSMTAIISALYSSTIHRMRKTWDYVSSKTTEKLERMNGIMNSSRNFGEYRNMLSLMSPPAVPFFGVFLTDLTFVEDGNPNYLDSDRTLVNFAKRFQTSKTIETIQQYQMTPFNLEEVHDIQRFLDRGFLEAPSIEEQYDTSLTFEPREKPGTDRVAKLLEENGIL